MQIYFLPHLENCLSMSSYFQMHSYEYYKIVAEESSMNKDY